MSERDWGGEEMQGEGKGMEGKWRVNELGMERKRWALHMYNHKHMNVRTGTARLGSKSRALPALGC